MTVAKYLIRGNLRVRVLFSVGSWFEATVHHGRKDMGMFMAMITLVLVSKSPSKPRDREGGMPFLICLSPFILFICLGAHR